MPIDVCKWKKRLKWCYGESYKTAVIDEMHVLLLRAGLGIELVEFIGDLMT
jgi:hypothetical protein